MTTKYILAVGCSFTIGHDAPSTDTIFGVGGREEAHNWPHHLGKLTNRKVVNEGKNGVGSFYMINKVYELVDRYKDKDCVVMVMWSGLHRYDMIWNDKWGNEQWIHSGMSETGREGFRLNYERYMYDDQNAYYHTILNMLNVQNFLKQKNIKYLFLTHKDILSEFYGKYKKINYLEKCIDWDNFYFHDGFKGCSEWCIENGLELDDTNHPYPEGYKKYAEHLHDKLKTKVF